MASFRRASDSLSPRCSVDTVYPFGLLAWNDLMWFLANGKALCDCSVKPGLSHSFPPHITSRADRHAVQWKALQVIPTSTSRPLYGYSTTITSEPTIQCLASLYCPETPGARGVCRRQPQRKGKSKSNDEGSPVSGKRSIYLVKIRRYNILQAAKVTELPQRTGS